VKFVKADVHCPVSTCPRHLYTPPPPPPPPLLLLLLLVVFNIDEFVGIYCSPSVRPSSQAIFEPPPENWRRPAGRPRTTWMKNIHDDLSSLDLGIHEARDLVQNRPLCRLMSLQRAAHSQWCMLLLH